MHTTVWFRTTLAALALLLSMAVANAQSIHTLPVGSEFEGKVKFARSEVPLPPGKWTLASAGEEWSDGPGGQMRKRLPYANLVQVDRGRLSALITILGTLSGDSNDGWTRHQNCDRSDMLYASGDTNLRTTDQWCAYVLHAIRSWVSTDQSPPRTATLYAYLREANVKAPRTMLSTTLNVVRYSEFIRVTYEVDPAQQGGPETKIQAIQTSEWHPQRIQDYPAHRAYADKWVEWSKPLLDTIKEGFGRSLRIAGLPPFPQAGMAALGIRLAPVGTQFVTGGGGFRVQSAAGMALTTVNPSNQTANWHVGGLVAIPSGQQFDQSSAEKLFPLKVGNKVVFDRFAAVGTNSWRHTVEVVGTEILPIDGHSYTTFVVEERTESLADPQNGYVRKRTVWFSPEAGWLLRLQDEQLRGTAATMNNWQVVKIVPPN